MEEAVIVFDDGRVFNAHSWAATGEICGQVVVTTAATGFHELMCDPENTGKILLFTTPHIGNTSVAFSARAGEPICVAGVIARDPVPRATNSTTYGELSQALAQAGVLGVRDVDTRAMVRHINGRQMSATIISGDELRAKLRPAHALTEEQ
ncbi:carbamoyl-phosphate synthase domain-containing protein [Trueperella sp. LYQ143]|uniref:carbamoyl-phosphate synthase domain-containing protein n=1 Tax=unclassified Trueperella TaxID=2630174 RepID=UPI003983409F